MAANTCSSVYPRRSIDLLLHAATQTPQPWHTPSFTFASHLTMLPCLSFTDSLSMAEYGQAVRQSQQALQVFLFTTDVIGSLAISSAENSDSTLLAAALPCATDSGISIGPMQVPARNIPAVTVSTGRSFGWYSL